MTSRQRQTQRALLGWLQVECPGKDECRRPRALAAETLTPERKLKAEGQRLNAESQLLPRLDVNRDGIRPEKDPEHLMKSVSF